MPETLATTDPVLDRIARTIVERFHPERVLLFGSRARGDAHPHSDYDILVILDPDPLGGDQVKAIHAAFDPPTTWSMDVVVQTPAGWPALRADQAHEHVRANGCGPRLEVRTARADGGEAGEVGRALATAPP